MKNCISRRSFLKAAGILGAAGALAACGGSSASTSTAASTASSTAASAAASSTSIKLWTYPIGGWGNDETVQGLVSSFNAKYPDIKVTVEYLDYTNGDDQVNTAIEGGSATERQSRGLFSPRIGEFCWGLCPFSGAPAPARSNGPAAGDRCSRWP